MTYYYHIHPIKTNTHKHSHLGQILMDLHEILTIGPQWENRHELNININFTQSNLPQVVTTYHDHRHRIKTNTYKPSYVGQNLMDCNGIFIIGTHMTLSSKSLVRNPQCHSSTSLFAPLPSSQLNSINTAKLTQLIELHSTKSTYLNELNSTNLTNSTHPRPAHSTPPQGNYPLLT